MRVWVIVLKGLGYMWLIIQVFLVQFIIVYDVHVSFTKGTPALEMSFSYIVWMVIYAIPGVVMLIAAEKLKTKDKRTRKLEQSNKHRHRTRGSGL